MKLENIKLYVARLIIKVISLKKFLRSKFYQLVNLTFSFLLEIEPDFREANKKIINAYKNVERSFDNEQKYDIDSRGWTFLDQRQFDQLCKEQRKNL